MAGTEVIYFPSGLQLPWRQDFPARFPPEPVANSPPLAICVPGALSFRSRNGFNSAAASRKGTTK